MSTDTDLVSRHKASDLEGRDHRALLVAGLVVAGLAAALYLVALATHPWVAMLKGFDLSVYRMGGVLARNNPTTLYTWHLPKEPGIQFTYTPFAALVFAAITSVPFHTLMDAAAVVSIFALVATVWIAFRELGWRGTARIGATLLVSGIALWLEPIQRNLFLGQIELILMGLIVWDLCQPDRRWWKGAATGVAAGIKLVPLIFIAYLLLTRKFRQAAVAAGAFVVTVIIGFAALPHASSQWWLHGYFWQAGRTGFVGDQANQSLRGILTRLAGNAGTGEALWWIAGIVVGVLGLAAAVLLYRSGRQFAGLMACALTGLLISPISWDHHWVWIAPGLALLVDAAVRAGRGTRARAGWLAVAAAVVLSYAAWPYFWSRKAGLLQGGLIGYAPTTPFGHGDNPHYVEYHWHGLQLLAGNLYILAGAALFVIMLVVAARTRGRASGLALAPA